jgi:signal peptidase I
MVPTLVPGDLIMVNTWAYDHQPPKKGDLVVLKLNDGSNLNYIKRIVAEPNDSIALQDSVLIVNGEKVREDYLHELGEVRPYGRDLREIQLSNEEYFALGDYRDNSKDSRKFGPVSATQIVGNAIYIWFSSTEEDGIKWERFPRKLQ